MTKKRNDNDFAFLLGSGASVEAGVVVSSEWHSLLEPSLDKKFRSSLEDISKSLIGSPFDTGDVNDGEKTVRALGLLAANEVAYEFRTLKAKLSNSPKTAKAFRAVDRLAVAYESTLS